MKNVMTSSRDTSTSRTVSMMIPVDSAGGRSIGPVLGHRIRAAGMPGMAAQHPPRRQPTAAPGSEPAHREHGVGGATGVKPAAAPEERAERDSIGVQQAEQQPAHDRETVSSRSNAASTSARASTAPWSRSTTSLAGKRCWRRRNASRAQRRTRLRSTARRRARFEMTSPSRAWPAVFGSVISSMAPWRRRRPRRNTSWNCCGVSRRC